MDNDFVTWNNFSYHIENKKRLIVTDYSGNFKRVEIPYDRFKYLDIFIEDEVFLNHTEIEEVILPNNVIELGNSVFEGCSNLKAIHLNDNLMDIGSSCFSGCSSLIKIDLPKNINEIMADSFKDCTKLKEVKILGELDNIYYGAFEGCKSLIELEAHGGDLVVDEYAFSGCTKLKRVILKKLEYVEDLAFMGCKVLESVELWFNKKYSVGNEAFYDCKRLEAIYYKEDKFDIVCPSSIYDRGLASIKLNDIDYEYTELID